MEMSYFSPCVITMMMVKLLRSIWWFPKISARRAQTSQSSLSPRTVTSLWTFPLDNHTDISNSTCPNSKSSSSSHTCSSWALVLDDTVIHPTTQARNLSIIPSFLFKSSPFIFYSQLVKSYHVYFLNLLNLSLSPQTLSYCSIISNMDWSPWLHLCLFPICPS